MSEQIYTFSDEELARMFKSGEMRLLTKPEEVAHDEPKISKELLKNIETLQIGGMSKETLLEELKKADFGVSQWAEELLESTLFNPTPAVKEQKIAIVAMEQLDLDINMTYEEVLRKARNSGLGICPAEVGPYLRFKYNIQPPYDNYLIAMNPILDKSATPCIFNVTTGIWKSLCLFALPTRDWLLLKRKSFRMVFTV